jgi:hypothetical protein
MKAGRKVNLIKKLKNRLGLFQPPHYSPQPDARVEIIRKKTKLRRNFLPTLTATLFLWLTVVFILNYVDPYTAYSLTVFLLFLFLALFFTFSVLTSSKRRGVLVSFGIILILIFRYFGLGNFINIFLIAGIMAVAELYFSKR